KRLFINEDQDLAIRLLKLDYKISYVASSMVIHGHMNNLYDIFVRYYRFGQGWKIINNIHSTFITEHSMLGGIKGILSKFIRILTISARTHRSLRGILSTTFGIVFGSIAFALGCFR
ncbi:MAG: hypothetical protein Q6363_007175, partial [Candidatus Njordarchaeota archaeon]